MEQSRTNPKIALIQHVVQQPWSTPAWIALLVLLFYSVPLFSPHAGIHWDAADIHYPLQRYFADRIFKGIPFWTPYVLSGYPILANPEMQAWYPPNWPLYLAGFGPRSIEIEIVFHAFLACLGAYYLISRMGVGKGAAAVGSLAFGLSGFFAGHTSHVTLFATAAWFPWLLLAYQRAAESPGSRSGATAALVAGAMILAGYYQAAILGLCGLVCYAAFDAVTQKRKAVATVRMLAGIAIGGVALSAIALLPAMQLALHSGGNPPNISDGSLQTRSLLTLAWPNARGTLSGTDKGLITDHYYYAGILVLPLILAGVWKSRMRWAALAIGIPAIWYMLGPAAGVYRLGAGVAGSQMSGPPDLAWFLAALPLAWLAAAGAEWLLGRTRISPLFLVAFFFADLWCCNLLFNPLPFGRQSYEDAYGIRELTVGRRIATPQLPLSRFDAPGNPFGAGPKLHPLDLKFETTYGYFVLVPRAYHEYREAMPRNAWLRDGLNISRYVDPKTGSIELNTRALPRAYFPKAAVDVPNEDESRKALEILDANHGSIVLGSHPPIEQDVDAVPYVVSFDEQSYRVQYTAKTPSLLKLSVDSFPGWGATLDGNRLPSLSIVRVDHTMMGVVVPPGDHVVEFRFHSQWYLVGLLLSGLTLVILLILSFDIRQYVLNRITGKTLRMRTRAKIVVD